MKIKLLIIALLAGIAGCGTDHTPVIIGKEIDHDAPGMCKYSFQGLGYFDATTFFDSCSLYRIGDTVVGKRVGAKP